MKKMYSDLRSGIVLVVLCIFFWFVLIPRQIILRGPAQAVGADFFPRLMVIIIAICGLVLAGKSALGIYKHKERFQKERAEGLLKTNYAAYLPHVMFIAAAFVYLWIMPHVGFVIASILFLLFCLWRFGSQGIVKNLLIAFIYVPIIFFIFNEFFRVRFPLGPLGFLGF